MHAGISHDFFCCKHGNSVHVWIVEGVVGSTFALGALDLVIRVVVQVQQERAQRLAIAISLSTFGIPQIRELPHKRGKVSKRVPRTSLYVCTVVKSGIESRKI